MPNQNAAGNTGAANTTPSDGAPAANAAQAQQTEGSTAHQKIFTQEEVNALVGKVRQDERAKYVGFDDFKARAERLDAVESELNAANKRAEDAEKKAGELERARQLTDWAAQASRETGVPASVLRGQTLEEMQAHAAQISAAMPIYPQVGNDPAGNQQPPQMTKEQILAIENARERKAAIAANLALFD